VRTDAVEHVRSSVAETRAPIRRQVEARKGRHRLYPVSAIYTGASLIGIAYAVRSHPRAAVLSYLLGVAAWTWLEYLLHRFVLHGRSFFRRRR